MSEHSDRYSAFAASLAEALKVTVRAIDHRAHGRTACPAGKADTSGLGLFRTSKDKSKIDCLQVMGGDLLDLITQTSGSLPIVIFGHSMGSVVTRCALRAASPEILGRIRGVVLSGVPTVPAHFERIPLLILLKSGIALGRGQGLLHNIVFNKFDGAVRSQRKNKKLPSSCFISSVDAEVKAFNEDPLCGQTIDLHIWKGLRSAMIELQSPKTLFANLENAPRFPILFISGNDDPVCNYGKTAESDAAKMTSLGFPVTLVSLSGCLHEFLHEHEAVKQEGTHIVSSWISSKLYPSKL